MNCIINFPEFDMQVSAAVGNACADQIRRINGAFERKIATENGWDYVTSLMHCEKDMWTEVMQRRLRVHACISRRC